MVAKIAARTRFFVRRALAVLVTAVLATSLCMPQLGYSSEPLVSDGQIGKTVPEQAESEDAPAGAQLSQAVPLDLEAPQKVGVVPLAEGSASADEKKSGAVMGEDASGSDTPADEASETVRVTFTIADEPTASWPDTDTGDQPTKADTPWVELPLEEGVDAARANKVLEGPAAQKLGSAVPAAPVSSDESLAFEGWQTEDFTRTYSEKEMTDVVFSENQVLHAVFAQDPRHASESDARVSQGPCGTCTWSIDDAGTLTIAPSNGVSGELASLGGAWPWLKESQNIKKVVIASKVIAGSSIRTMFMGCQSLIEANMSGLDVSNAQELDWMFQGCSSLQTVNLSGWDFSQATTLKAMFMDCSSLTSLYLDGNASNASNLENIEHIFAGCAKLAKIPTDAFKKAKVAKFSSAFNGCSRLSSLDLSSWDFSNVQSFSAVFKDCIALTSVKLPKVFNVVGSVAFTQVFYNCPKLTEIPESFNFGSSPYSIEPSAGCFKVLSGPSVNTTYNGGDLRIVQYGWSSQNRTLPISYRSGSCGGCIWAMSASGQLSIRPSSQGNGVLERSGSEPFWPWRSELALVTSVEVRDGVIGCEDMSNFINSCPNLTSADLRGLDTANVKKMEWMFYECRKLTSVDLSRFDTRSLQYVGNMFNGCSQLSTVAFPSTFSMANVADVGAMFANCSSLASIDLTNWGTNTAKIGNMASMFENCVQLSSMTLPNNFGSKSWGKERMFYNCPKLTRIPDNFEFARHTSVTTDCFKIPSGGTVATTYNGSDPYLYAYNWAADGRSLNTSRQYGSSGGCEWLIDATGKLKIVPKNRQSGTLSRTGAAPYWPWLSYATSIKTVAIENGVGTGTSAAGMLSGCTNVTSVALSGLTTIGAKDLSAMFENCAKLTTIDITKFDTSQTTNMARTFSGCSNLKTLKLPATFNVSSMTDMSGMFYGCNKLVEVPSSFAIKAGTNTTNLFKITAGSPVVTKYAGNSIEVKNYNWPADGRALSGLALSGTVSITGNSSVSGNTLTAKPVFGTVCSNASPVYQWYRASNSQGGNAESIAGATSNTYVTTTSDAGKYILCKVTDGLKAYTGTLSSAGVGPVKIAFKATVQVSGDKRTGATLTASVSNQNSGSEALSYQWYRSAAPSGTGSAIQGATSATYVQAAADRGMHLSCEVKVADVSAWTGSVRSAWHGPSLTEFAATVNVSGEAVIGKTLTASVPSHNAQGETLAYQWQRSSGSSWVNIDKAIETAYTLVDADLRANVRCVVSAPPARFVGSAASSAVGPAKGHMTGSATLSGRPYANQTLTVSVTGLPSGATAIYRWFTCDTSAAAGKTAISQASASKTIDLSLVDASKIVGKYVLCEVSDSSGVFLGTIATPVSAQVGIAWGAMGPSVGGCVWRIDASGTLVVEPASAGIGQLGEVTWNAVPWTQWTSQVKSARFSSGVKSGASLRGLFSGCTALKTVDFAGLDASSAKDLASLFARCESLTEVKGLAGAFSSAKPTAHGGMFSECRNLTALDVTALDTSASLDMSNMFAGCSRLGTLTGVERLRSAAGVKLSGMFKGCTTLSSVSLQGMTGGDPSDLTSLFEGCSGLVSVNLPAGLIGSKCLSVERAFYGCNALKVVPSNFSFGSNAGIHTTDCFYNTSGEVLHTTYLGDDERVVAYAWEASNRSLAAWMLTGSIAIEGGDDPLADCTLAAAAAFSGPAADLAATYRWCTATSADDPDPQPIEGAAAATYTPVAADVGKHLVCFAAAPAGSGAEGEIRAATSKPVRAPQLCLSIPQETRVYVDSLGRVSAPDSHAYALGSTDAEGKASEGDIALVGVTLTLGSGDYPGGQWTLGTPESEGAPASVFVEAQPFTTAPGTVCAVDGAPVVESGASLPLQWEASFKNDIGPKLAQLLAAAEGEGARYGNVEFKVAWRPRS